MNNPTIQDIFISGKDEYIKNNKLSKEQWKVFNAILRCRTEKLGFHTITCQECGETFVLFNSCRNRHCPMCQAYKKEQWIQKETSNLLNCTYFHIITTVPVELNEICMYNQKEFYNILFKATSESILELANDPKWLGAKVGITSILHTWGQTLELHPHIHSIVTGGGLNNNKWIQSKKEYIFKVQVLSSLFKGKVLSMIKHLDLTLPKHLEYLKNYKQLNKFLEPLYKKEWVTYIEPPKCSSENVIEYVGRYSFRVAISNERIRYLNLETKEVTFEYKDYKDNGKIKLMTISVNEFIRRFLLHVLPQNFTKIKHYGILTNRNKKSLIKLCRILIGEYMFNDFSTNISTKRKLHEFRCPSCNSTSFTYSFHYNRLNLLSI